MTSSSLNWSISPTIRSIWRMCGLREWPTGTMCRAWPSTLPMEASSELAPGERLITVEDLAAFQFRYGTDLPVAGQWNGGLSNSSERRRAAGRRSDNP